MRTGLGVSDAIQVSWWTKTGTNHASEVVHTVVHNREESDNDKDRDTMYSSEVDEGWEVTKKDTTSCEQHHQ